MTLDWKSWQVGELVKAGAGPELQAAIEAVNLYRARLTEMQRVQLQLQQRQSAGEPAPMAGECHASSEGAAQGKADSEAMPTLVDMQSGRHGSPPGSPGTVPTVVQIEAAARREAQQETQRLHRQPSAASPRLAHTPTVVLDDTSREAGLQRAGDKDSYDFIGGRCTLPRGVGAKDLCRPHEVGMRPR